MQYISPLHFLPLSTTDQFDRKELMLARKKMLAELELNDDNGITVNGKHVVKNDIVRFFDDLQDSSGLPFHTAVYRDSVLLKFLEQNTLKAGDQLAHNALYDSGDFIAWISAYYANSFYLFSNECLQESKDEQWTTLLQWPLLMNSYHREEAWECLEKKIRTDIEMLRFMSEKKMNESDVEDIDHICNFRRVMMLQRLPFERFGSLMDELAFEIMQVCINAFNNADRTWAVVNIQNAEILALSEDLKKQVTVKQREMDRLSEEKNPLSDKHTPMVLLRIALIVIFFAFRASGGCSHSDPADAFKNAPVQIIQPGGDTTVLYPDGTLRKKNTESGSQTLDTVTIRPAPNLLKSPSKHKQRPSL